MASGSGGSGGGGVFLLPRRNYDSDKNDFKTFFLTYKEDKKDQQPKYMQTLGGIARREERVISVNLDDVFLHTGSDELPHAIESNVLRYMEVISKAIDEILFEEFDPIMDIRDPTDFLVKQHYDSALAENEASVAVGGLSASARVRRDQLKLPPALLRRYELRFERRPSDLSVLGVRQIRAHHIGHLITIRGMVTRVSEVRPQITVATYVCPESGDEIYQEVLGTAYMPIFEHQRSDMSQARGRLLPQTRGSKFVKFQEMKIQELANDVPIGHVPRTMTVLVHGELTRSCGPGDEVTIDGVYLPIARSGYAAIKAGLVADTFFEALNVHKHKSSYSELLSNHSDSVERALQAFLQGSDQYKIAAFSIAPEIFGHEDVKKALLLQLVGGVTNISSDGMRIRGDINICLMGDPGVAKSQLLKQCARISPRGVYTTGKGSSGVGLTAAVMKDSTTNEFVLEGGALVLADMGLCCIDEFDKMEDSDRTSIHEVMEQQTVSIAKAGITTTLNARTSILAAANPAYGRYNALRSPSENINLPAALLSRFDILFLLMDRPNQESDLLLARHITAVHRNEAPPLFMVSGSKREFLDHNTLRAYIAMAREHNPVVPEDVQRFLINEYVRMRADEESRQHSYTTARSLLSVLRLSQALARLRFSDSIAIDDVTESLRLIDVSKQSLEEELQHRDIRKDPISEIYSIAKVMAETSGVRQISKDHFIRRAVARGFSMAQINACIREYVDLDTWVETDDTILFTAGGTFDRSQR